MPASSRALSQKWQRVFLFIGCPMDGSGNAHSPNADVVSSASNSRAASPSRTCLGPVLASMRASRSGFTSRHRNRRISPGLHPVSRISRTAATSIGQSQALRRSTAPSRDRSFSPQQSTPRWAAIACDPCTGVAGGLGTMPPCDCAGEHVAQDVVRPVSPARTRAPIPVKPACHVGARDGIHAKGTKHRQDGTMQVTHGRLVR